MSYQINCVFNHASKVDLLDRKYWGQWAAEIWEYVDPTHSCCLVSFFYSNTSGSHGGKSSSFISGVETKGCTSLPQDLLSWVLDVIACLTMSEQVHITMCGSPLNKFNLPLWKQLHKGRIFFKYWFHGSYSTEGFSVGQPENKQSTCAILLVLIWAEL